MIKIGRDGGVVHVVHEDIIGKGFGKGTHYV